MNQSFKLYIKSKLLCVILLISISISLINTVHSQFLKLPQNQNFEFGAVLSGKKTPFWLVSNNYGLISPNGSQTYIKSSFKTHLDSARSFDYCYNIEVIGKYSNVFKSYFHQAYFETKFKFLNFYIGSKEENFGNQDKDLSSGNLLWSGNARPMPKVMVYTPDFVKVPFTKGYIEIIGGLAHGWFGKNEFVNNAWLHHKYIGFRIGGNLPVRLNHQFHHFAQWGGVSADTSIGKLPSSWGDFKNIFLGRSGKHSSDVIQNEALNMVGNHLGMDNYGIEVELKNYLFNAYWQHMYEDGSGKAWKNIKDGLWGITLTFKKGNYLKKILLEYINTTDQSGGAEKLTSNPDSITGYEGNDNYFVNYLYKMGWSYKGMTIGTPFISTVGGEKLNPNIPVNNKIQGVVFGLLANYKTTIFTFKTCLINNYGLNAYPKNDTQLSLYFNTQFLNVFHKKNNLSIEMAFDKSKYYYKGFGLVCRFNKTF